MTHGEITYVIRTTEPLEKKDAPPALPFFELQRSFAFVSERENPSDRNGIQLTDNGRLDLAPAKHEFRLRLNTAGWKERRWKLAIFAHNTKEKRGGYKSVRALFDIDIKGNRVKLINMNNPSRTQFAECRFSPPSVRQGESARLIIEASQDDLKGVKIQVPHHPSKEDVLPGFRYDEITHTAALSDSGSEIR